MNLSDKATMHEEIARDVAIQTHQARVNQNRQTCRQCFDTSNNQQVVCCSCEDALSQVRLQAQPYAIYCVACQTILENG